MNKLKGGLILLLIFIASIYCSFYFEESYRKLIRHLYETLSNGKISFFVPKKNLHFPSGEFVLSFGFFMVTFCFFSYRQTKKQRVLNIVLGLFFLLASILVQSYLDSFLKIAGCTACSDGTMQLHYGDINYDLIFITSLIFAIIPVVTTEIRKLIKLKRKRV
jgi:hypothetical protein